MSNQPNSNDEVLARLVREAGDPDIAPDPHYAETLKATILGRAASIRSGQWIVASGQGKPASDQPHISNPQSLIPIPCSAPKRVRKTIRIAKFAVAATILVALSVPASWLTIGGGSTNIAFADVAKALDRLRSATYDVTSESKDEMGQTAATTIGKGFFLAPSHYRTETTTKLAKNALVNRANNPAQKAANEALMDAPATKQITIIDSQTGKVLTLMPNMKLAVTRDMRKFIEEMKKSGRLAKDAPTDEFEMVRRLVCEGNSGTGEKVQRLGKKAIDGREAVGFQTHTEMGDTTIWADPETARPVRIDVRIEMGGGGRLVMSDFRYDVNLDPTLFSLEPPAGYLVQSSTMTAPVEEDLLRTLRTIAEHSKGIFPPKVEANKEVLKALMLEVYDPKISAEMDTAMNAARAKIEAKYGGKKKLKERYGEKLPPDIMAEILEASALAQRKIAQKTIPLMQKQMQGIIFYTTLKPENDPHYIGGGVKLGTPARPILWYKPTGAEIPCHLR